MKVLLDTSAFIRFAFGEKIPRRALRLIEGGAELPVSIVTPWEIAILNNEAIGKQRRIELPSRRVSEIMEAMGARLLPMSLIHTAAIHTLPLHHHDPFDRMIIAQALEERCPLVSSDERFEAYKSAGLQLIWE